MDVIKRWIICIVVSALAGTLVYFLSANSSVQKALKTVISIFVLCALLSPFLDGNSIKIDDDLLKFTYEYESLQNSVSEQMLRTAEKQAELKVGELLENMEIKNYQIEATADTDKDNCIFMKQITVILNKKYKNKERQMNGNIKSMFNIDGEFIWE